MTVRVNKSAFNIREKLSELERPIGVKGNELMRAETAQDARDFISAGRKNYLINGNALVWQRATSSINQSDYNAYGCDRFWFSNGATSLDRSTSVPSGFQYSMKYTSNGNYSTFGQAIELTATGISQFEAGKEYTLSVWARTDSGVSNLQFVVYYRNSKFSNTNQTNWLPSYAPTVGQMTTEWKKFTYTFTAPTVNSNNQVLAIEFGFTKTAYFTGLQLESGKNATEFEHRSYGEELALCQRYYYRVYGGRYEWRSSDYNTYRNGSLGSGSHPVTMRQTPTMGHNLTGDSTNINPSTVASPVGAWSWYSWATGWGTSSSINSGTIANWGLDPTTNGWAGGIYYISPSNYSHVTHMQISSQSYIEANAEL